MPDNIPDNIQIKLVITGRVQGVFFRAETKKTADRLGINGYVKNLSDGSVEAVIKGDQASVSQMIEWCRKGPAISKVKSVKTEEISSVSHFNTFDVRY